MKSVERYAVSIFGEQCSLMSDDGPEAVARLSGRIDALMREISLKTGINDTKRVAILALLKITHQLQELESSLQQKDHEESQLINYINQQLSSLSS